LELPLNAETEIKVTEAGMVILVIPDELNAPLKILVAVLGIVKAVRAVQPENAEAPMLVAFDPLGKVTLFKLEQPLNTPSGNRNPDPHVTLTKLVQEANAESYRFPTLLGITTLIKLLHVLKGLLNGKASTTVLGIV